VALYSSRGSETMTTMMKLGHQMDSTPDNASGTVWFMARLLPVGART